MKREADMIAKRCTFNRNHCSFGENVKKSQIKNLKESGRQNIKSHHTQTSSGLTGT